MTVIAISFVVYTAFIVGAGLYSARYARRSDEDYFLAGRSLGPWVAALSASASSESGWVTVGLVGLAFASGVSAYWLIPGCLLGFLFNWLVIARRLRIRSEQVGALTLPDMFARHFNERIPILRLLSVIIILTAMTMYVAAQFAAAGKAFDGTFDNVTFTTGVLIGVGIVLIYTVLGGFRAACWTDFVQAFIMFGALVVFPAYLLYAHGGFGFIANRLVDVDDGALLEYIPAAKSSGAALLGFLLGVNALGINFGYPGQPHVLVRFMALREAKDARIGAVIASTWLVFIIAGAVTVGIMARAIAEGPTGLAGYEGDIESFKEMALVISARELLHGTIAGLVLAAILAAICSTADSQLVVAASAAANDLYARIFKRDGKASHIVINRITIVLLALIAMWFVLRGQSEDRTGLQVYELVTEYGWAVLGAAFGPQLILMLLWRGATYAGCIAGMLTGFILPIGWHSWYPQLQQTYPMFEGVEMYNLTVAFIAALLINIAVSLLTRR